MAVIVENFTENGRAYTRTYSDAGRYVVRDGDSYSEAVDPAEYGRTYTEGDLMEQDDGVDLEEMLAAKAEAYDILMGVRE